jgi:hypothetical protein
MCSVTNMFYRKFNKLSVKELATVLHDGFLCDRVSTLNSFDTIITKKKKVILCYIFTSSKLE